MTAREVEGPRLTAGGLNGARVAERLHTVNAHLRSIYGKPGVPSRAATRFALDHGLR